MSGPTEQTREIKSYTLDQFIETSAQLFQHNPREFQTFVLTGNARSFAEQAYIDVQPNMLTNDYPLVPKRDIDSLIGITNDIVVESTLCFYPVPNPAEVLRTPIHLSLEIEMEDETVESVPYHYLPNFQFAYWGSRCQIYIVFPSLYDFTGAGSVQLTDEAKAEFYNLGVRPAVEQLLPESASDWPPDYETEVWRARQSTGRMAYGTKMMAPQFFQGFVNLLRRNLAQNQVEWASEFFFIHTVRGVKLGNFHRVDPASAACAQEDFFAQVSIPVEATQSGRWWIDIGIEFQSEEAECLQWTTLSHSSVIRDFLGITDAQAIRMTGLGSSRYERDTASHLNEISGCRVEPRSNGGQWEVAYVQLYTTDKAVTYNPERGHYGKAIAMKDAMGSKQPPDFIDGLFDTYQASRKIISHARIEVRVPIRYSLEVLLQIPARTVRRSLAAFNRDTWWSFRQFRLTAMSQILCAQAASPSTFRVRHEALLLTAAIVWLVNGLHSRPDDGSAARGLMRAILPLTDSDVDHSMLMFTQRERSEDNGGTLPYNPYGVVFLRPIMVHFTQGSPRFRGGGPALSERDFVYWFRMDVGRVRLQYHDRVIARTINGGGARRVQNKTRVTATRQANPDVPDVPMFDLESQGFSVDTPQDEGLDVDMEADAGSRTAEEDGGLDSRLSGILRQFWADALNKAPNRAGAGETGYLKLSKEERTRAGEEVFQNARLSDYWRDVYYKVAPQNELDVAFGNIFPNLRRTSKPANTQNYFQMQYFQRWSALCAEVDDQTIEAMRTELKKRFDNLRWIPWAQVERFWVSKGPKGSKRDPFTRLPPGSNGPAPRVLARSTPVWQND